MSTTPARHPSAAAMPETPDFDSYPVEHRPVRAEPIDRGVRVVWDDGLETRHHAIWLRENSPDAGSLHPVTREQTLMLPDIPADLSAVGASVAPAGVLHVHWSDGSHESCFHPGWLRVHAAEAKHPHFDLPARELWGAALVQGLPRFEGPGLLRREAGFEGFLEALHRYGVALVQALPETPDSIERLAESIGPIRASNFGRVFEVRSKPDADSNAYTSMALPLHTDLATREYTPGLQFLFCMRNDAAGGESLLADGFHVARILAREAPEDYGIATTLPLQFASRAADSDYRWRAPMIALDRAGGVEEVRVSPWLRAPQIADIDAVDRSYRALRRLLEIAARPENRISLRLAPGELLAFDNRRTLHGRTGYDPASGERWLRGCYVDREELVSRLRIVGRKRRRDAVAAARASAPA